MTTYKGWTNYATWRVMLEMRVRLEMFDGIDPSDMGWSDLDAYDLGQALKEYCIEMIEQETNHKGTSVPLALSYALAFLADVNWREIAEHMIDAYSDA